MLDEAVLDHQEDGLKLIWVFDNRERANPVSIATFPTPAEADYAAKGGHFGPHNLHENRPGAFQSSSIIFATYQNAGVRAFDISNPYRPEEIGFYVPPTPQKWFEPMRGRTRALHTGDVFVAADGVTYITDYDAGLTILQWRGS